MKRTFHSRFTLQSKLTTALLGAVVFWLLWTMSLAALPVMILLILSIERIIHTEYLIDDSGTLTVCKGRFSRTETIDAGRIKGIRQISNIWTKGLVIELSDGRRIAVQPQNEGEFIRKIYSLKEKAGGTSDTEACQTAQENEQNSTYEENI